MTSLELRMIVLVAYSKKPMSEKTSASATVTRRQSRTSRRSHCSPRSRHSSSANGT